MGRSFGTANRRMVLGGLLAAGLAGAAGIPEDMATALAEPRRRGTLDEVEHVVILMQENRSFDHYYGTMAGVRGFGDRAALRLPGGGDPVFRQPDAGSGTGYLLPFRVDTGRVDGQDMGDLAHDWHTTHVAWAGGAYNSWIPAKSRMTMGYFTDADIPFHRALAGAFTLCDHYFCSLQGPTTPNRLYHWTGTIDPGGTAGGPATGNPADYRPVYRWTTYPERLQQAGISWQVFADDRVGDDTTNAPFLGDYGDNPLWLFQQYHDALDSDDPAVRQLAERAMVTKGWKPADGVDGTEVDSVLERFVAACANNTLPQVSWLVAPYGYCEHPAARPVDGAVYTQRVLKALWDNPKLWESTVVLINYDENDGFFDHLVPPTPPPGAADEWLPLGQFSELADLSAALGPMVPIGLGPRVPLTVISPWSRGGWVNSQVFDHTSVLRFLEAWTGVREPNISQWRRAVCGDLTSCFDFTERDLSIPLLPDANELRRQADRTQTKLPKPEPPNSSAQQQPFQDPGYAKARPLPYQPVAWVQAGAGAVTVHYGNRGSAAVPFQTYPYQSQGSPVRQTVVGPNAEATERFEGGGYDLAVHAPNGFLVTAAGGPETAHLVVAAVLTGSIERPELVLRIRNSGLVPAHFTIKDGSGFAVAPGASTEVPIPAADGWYDVSLTLNGSTTWRRRFAGHLENGKPSRTG
ncbi:phospholipase C, phosphocholine-specific [Nocardia sp. CDC159]|uniref:phospholipase C n=1 Tax=Nocardia pulmonis TaxID=2951408 RepID=A0A9X2ED63_9NOCA|nr:MULTISPECIES: phospholipase C, phosphocholine-specific [Nocardia]MCM6778737.1 phospholipase C, phosphocholine-specific [Nocardia pulmonis]MCM6791626.1 phospholipase C, phosphocholine-specific [Nocardia sp. CDC159]